MKKVKGMLETFAKAMVQPLMFMSVAGMVMVIGVLVTQKNIINLLPFLAWEPIQVVGNIIYQGVMVLINNLAVVFVVGIPASLAKGDKHRAGLIGLLAYLVYLTTSNQILQATGKLAEGSEFLGLIGTGQAKILGIQCVDMGVFGGIILGCLVGWIYNKTYTKRFKGALQVYSGANWSFLWIFFVAILFGAVSNLVWPVIQSGITDLANVIKNTGSFGLFLYGFLERLLLPTGLHHLIYTPFQFSDLGGVMQMGDETVAGAYAIYAAEAMMPDVTKFSDSIYYMAIGFTKMFGYIGIGAAFIHTAYPENRKKTTATIVPLVVTASLGAITEPIDFMFVFAAPLLYLVHAVIAGLFIALLSVFNVTSFCGGNLITGLISNIAQGVEKTNWPVMLLLGVIEIVVYFVVFSFMIKKFKYHTPGREGDPLPAGVTAEEAAAAIGTDASAASPKDEGKKEKAADGALDAQQILAIIKGLGGPGNINKVENCFTRLRVNITDPGLLDESEINKSKPKGIMKKDNDIQIVYGLEVADIRRAVEDQLNQMREQN